jgi:chromatin remodeling complex protein RSC6
MPSNVSKPTVAKSGSSKTSETKQTKPSETKSASKPVSSKSTKEVVAPVVASAPVPAQAPVAAPAQAPVQESVPASTEESSSSVSDEFTAVLAALSEVQRHVKELTNQVKGLQRHVSKEHRDLEKSSRGRRKKGGDGDKPKRAPSGFAKPTGLSPELCAFLGMPVDTQLARTEVTKKINAYVKEHSLNNPENKKIIVPDAKLGALLSVPNAETLTYFNLQRYMKVHFQKAATA